MIPQETSKTSGNESNEADYKLKYKVLKRKLKSLIYEHELLMEELEKSQKKLLRVAKDRSFLLDRLLQYERTTDTSSDSEATDCSDSEPEKPKKKISQQSASQPTDTATDDYVLSSVKSEPTAKPTENKKKSKSNKKQRLAVPESSDNEKQLSIEEIHKHLDSRPDVMSIDKATSHMPSEIFSNEAPGAESDSDTEMDQDLVIDAK